MEYNGSLEAVYLKEQEREAEELPGTCKDLVESKSNEQSSSIMMDRKGFYVEGIMEGVTNL